MNAPPSMFSASLVLPAVRDAFGKLNPRELIRNPVMFVTGCVAALLTVLLLLGEPGLPIGFQIQLIVWLWLTVLFGAFAEALAEGRGRAQAASLRATKADLKAKLVLAVGDAHEIVPASRLEKGQVVLVETRLATAYLPRKGDPERYSVGRPPFQRIGESGARRMSR